MFLLHYPQTSMRGGHRTCEYHPMTCGPGPGAGWVGPAGGRDVPKRCSYTRIARNSFTRHRRDSEPLKHIPLNSQYMYPNQLPLNQISKMPVAAPKSPGTRGKPDGVWVRTQRHRGLNTLQLKHLTFTNFTKMVDLWATAQILLWALWWTHQVFGERSYHWVVENSLRETHYLEINDFD